MPAMTRSNRPRSKEADLQRERLVRVERYRRDPLGFVIWAFPWGEPGTALAGRRRPRAVAGARCSREIGARPEAPATPVRIAVASGHGVGKSALVAWIVLWALADRAATRAASSRPTPRRQLRTKTWPELAKWFGLAVCRDWFCDSAPRRSPRVRARAREDLAHRRGAVVGAQHRGLRRPAQQGPPRCSLVFDEASAIADADLGDGRRRADRRRHRDRLARLRQPDAQRRPLPRMLRPLPHRWHAPPGRRRAVSLHQQGADRRVGERLRRGLRLRARARARRLPARRRACSSSTASASTRRCARELPPATLTIAAGDGRRRRPLRRRPQRDLLPPRPRRALDRRSRSSAAST